MSNDTGGQAFPIPILSRPKVTTKQAYQAGRDYAINGANTNNCHFSIFMSGENTAEWERGAAEACEAEKRRREQ